MNGTVFNVGDHVSQQGKTEVMEVTAVSRSPDGNADNDLIFATKSNPQGGTETKQYRAKELVLA
jgi:hypothetical protein